MQSEMRPVYGVKCFTRPAVYVWCKKFAHGHESVADEEGPGRRIVSTTNECNNRSSRFSHIVWPAFDGKNDLMNLDDTLKSETLTFDV